MLEAEEFRDKMLGLGLEKLHILQKEYGCALMLGRFKGREIVIALFRGVHALYAKIMPAEYVPSAYLHCNYIDYIPLGLYAFGETIDELAKRVRDKLDKVVKARYEGIEI